jgi:thiamine pyrophosphate-dependent acetolactate synthase large subunit-like protein
MIAAARYPMIWVGSGSMTAGPAVRAFAARIGALQWQSPAMVASSSPGRIWRQLCARASTLVTVLFNNNSYDNVLRDQRRLQGGGHGGAGLTNPDVQAQARAFGVPSWRVTEAAGLRETLQEALAVHAPCLIEVMTDITQEPSPLRFLAAHRP